MRSQNMARLISSPVKTADTAGSHAQALKRYNENTQEVSLVRLESDTEEDSASETICETYFVLSLHYQPFHHEL